MILLAGNVVGVIALWSWWNTGSIAPLTFVSPMEDVTVSIAIDSISAFFLIPILIVTALSSIYGLSYWRQSEHPENGRRVSLFLGMITGAIILLVVAHDGLMFLAAWEAMAVSALFLVATEDHLEETRKAAWLYIAASHFATLCAFGVFALLFAINGSWEFASLKQTGTVLSTLMAVLAFAGFGTKAGMIPVHVWLPSAHSQAPSHVSAIMSGVMIKMGIYGIVRVCTFFPEIPLSWGGIVLVVGTVSAILGVAFAIGQHDLKRLLAYHSIENIGIILMGLGLALVGRSVHQPLWVMCGLCGGLLHVWNHAIFKSLLFLGAGSVIHTVGTRQIDALGGLARRMPVTAACFLIGAVAICGLPPLNGFVSEFFVYFGMFQIATTPETTLVSAAVLAAPGLAFSGALAAACFVKVYGVVFLGVPRSEEAACAHEASPAMIVPMTILAALCVAIGIAPFVLTPFLDTVAMTWSVHEAVTASIGESVPFMAMSLIAVLFTVLSSAGLAFLLLRGIRQAPRTVTWDCGYAAPSQRMQYTSSSFAEMLVQMFHWILQPKIHPPKINALFPVDAQFESHVNDTVLEKCVWPATRAVARLCAWGRRAQSGSMQAYLLYIFVVTIFLLLWR
jgi:hydrogenase-4 component B